MRKLFFMASTFSIKYEIIYGKWKRIAHEFV